MGVLNVLPLLGGDHWRGHGGQEVSAESPVPFSICSTFIATRARDVIKHLLLLGESVLLASYPAICQCLVRGPCMWMKMNIKPS